MSGHETIEASSFTQDLTQFHPGDQLEAVRQGVVHHQGVVEDIAPAVGVVWVRDSGIGERKMLATDTFELHIP